MSEPTYVEKQMAEWLAKAPSRLKEQALREKAKADRGEWCSGVGCSPEDVLYILSELDRRGQEIELLERARAGWEAEALNYAKSRECQQQMTDAAVERANTAERERDEARAERDRAQVERDELRAGLMIPGEQRCPECLFSLHKLQVRAEDGAIRHLTIMAIEDCPNGHGPLVGVTYEQGWREMVRAASSEAARAEVLNDKLDTAERALAAANAKLESAGVLVFGIRDGLARRELGQHLTDCQCSLHALLALLSADTESPEPEREAGSIVAAKCAICGKYWPLCPHHDRPSPKEGA